MLTIFFNLRFMRLMVKDYKLAKIDKENKDQFFKVISNFMGRDDKISVE